MSTITIGLVQLACSENIKINIEKTIEKVREAASKGAKIICLQELYHAEYFAQNVSVYNYELAISYKHDALQMMQQLAKELCVVLIVPFYEWAAKGIYFNSAAVFDADGKYLGTTRKNHIPDGPNYHEKYYFTPGNTGYPVYDTTYGRIGVGICWDEWFPEVARILTLKGAEILFYPSAIGSEPDYPELSTKQAWTKAISAHGIHNGVFVAAVNRVGQEKDMTFYGGSFISNPMGEIICSLEEEEGVLIQTIDTKEIENARNLLQFLRDRRTDTYLPLLEKEALKSVEL
ncbi:carbon-nitrogen hydrolase [Bacillus pseudomycoides]|uniref:Carbon-nitrogen hydrolase n=1 Tax=Bacillus bingmayongensis TaxID=1150157 RepID=A0ABU5JWH2_9BACI|nr:carbon-nitrogen hydrolase [Bacillus pseudomycoides]